MGRARGLLAEPESGNCRTSSTPTLSEPTGIGAGDGIYDLGPGRGSEATRQHAGSQIPGQIGRAAREQAGSVVHNGHPRDSRAAYAERPSIAKGLRRGRDASANAAEDELADARLLLDEVGRLIGLEPHPVRDPAIAL